MWGEGLRRASTAVKEKQYSYVHGANIIRRWDVMQPEGLRNDRNVSKVQNYKNYEINEMRMWERTLSEGKESC